MTHEDEEVQCDLSKLQEQVHQISLSQRATKNEVEVLKKGMEARWMVLREAWKLRWMAWKLRWMTWKKK